MFYQPVQPQPPAFASHSHVAFIENRPIVSHDIVGDAASCIFDSALTDVTNGTLVKAFGWYDNEWGYSNRIVELAEYIGDKL